MPLMAGATHTGPGHGGPGLVASTYLEGTYTEIYPNAGGFSHPADTPSPVAAVLRPKRIHSSDRRFRT
jgi:XFP N-terminal domain